MLKVGAGESSDSECGWTGVVCNDTTNTVTGLDFVDRANRGGAALASALSKDLGLLSNLVFAKIANNSLTGGKPRQTFNFLMLTTII